MTKRALLLVLGLLVWVHPAFAADPTHYKAFTVASSQITGTLSNFPVLISEVDADFETIANGGCVSDAQGDDIRPYADSAYTTPLDYEMVPGTYVPTTGFFEMWVRVPSAAVGSVIYLFCGDTDLTTDGSTTGTWSSEYKLVAHLPDGSSLTVLDSTANADHGTNSNTVATAGKIDGGGAFNGTDRAIDFDGVSMTGGEYTLSFWATRDANGFLFALNNGSSGVTIISIDGGNWGGVSNGISWWDGSAGADLGTTDSIPDAFSLIHVTFSEDGNIVRGYVNGSQTGTDNSYADIPFNTELTFGSRVNHADNFSSASVDELRLIQAVLTADWIAAEYNNQNSPAAFTDKGTLTAFGGGGPAPGNGFLGLMGVGR